MAHAEKCPVCDGKGTVPPKGNCSVGYEDPCYGCDGKGWVEVSDGLNDVPVEFWPQETTNAAMLAMDKRC